MNVTLLIIVDAVSAIGDASLLDIDLTDLCILTVEDTCDFLKSWATVVEMSARSRCIRFRRNKTYRVST